MPSVTKTDLHLAQSFDELKRKAESVDFGKKDIKRIIEFASKFYSEAMINLRKGDDESAYLFLHRFSNLLSYIQTDSDRAKFLKAVGDIAKEAIKKMEYLTTELTQRYAEKNKNYEDRRAMLFNNQQPVPGTSVKVVEPVEENEEYYHCITSRELVKRIQSLSDISKILIIDIRSAGEFARSSIAANKFSATGEVYIINIPEDIITPGLTFPTLRNKISYRFGYTLNGLEQRRSMDQVIIIDGKTYEFTNGCPSYLLADAIWKWDQSPDKIKNRPLLLKGGFYDFVLTYPTYVTDSSLIENLHQASLPSLGGFKSGLNVSYDFFNEEQPVPVMNGEQSSSSSSSSLRKSSSVNHHTNKTTTTTTATKKTSIVEPSSRNQNDINHKPLIPSENKSIKIPGIAKPFIPDRSSKPIFENNNKNNNDTILNNNRSNLSNNTNNNMIRNFPPKPSHLISSLNNGNKTFMNGSIGSMKNNGDKNLYRDKDYNNDDDDDDDDDDDEDHGAGRMDSEDIEMNGLSPTRDNVNVNKIFPMDEEMSDYENNESGNEESMSHSVSKPLQVNNSSNNNKNDDDDDDDDDDNHNNHNNNNHQTSSLSRSLSSPNIAQFEQKFPYSSESPGQWNSASPKFSPQIPSVDRSVKPLPNYYYNNLRKVRDFSPQFSSCARIAGLRNLGNTCFMNAILQCLKNTKEFHDYLVSGTVHINPNSKFGSNGELTIELLELFKQMHHPSNYKHISPRDFKCAVSRHIPDFVDFKQQDAHEFLVRLLDRIHADLNRSAPNTDIYDPVVKDPNFYDKLSMKEAVNNFWKLHIKRNSSIITDLFEGLIVSTVTCLHCKSSSKNLEAFTCLTLPIPENVTKTTLQNCIDLFLRRERISNEAAWQCQECRQERDAEKCTYIWRLPKILIIHLKRFTYDGMWRQKISTFVDFPVDNLKIEAHGNEEVKVYSLYGVVNHFGSLEGGHYVAFSRNKEQNIDWNRYDDQDVSTIASSDVVTQNAYVLFYRSV